MKEVNELMADLETILELLNPEDLEWLNLDLDSLVKEPSKWRLEHWLRRLNPYVKGGYQIFPQELREKKVYIGTMVPVKALQSAGVDFERVRWDYQTRSYVNSQNKPVDVKEEGTLFICSDNEQYDRAAGGITYEELRFRNLAHQLEKRSLEERMDFLVQARDKYGFTRMAEPANTLRLNLSDSVDQNTKLWFTFGDSCQVVTPAREYEVRDKTYVCRAGAISSSTMLVMFGLELVASQRSQSQVDGFLNLLTQIWEEEDNYGRKLEKNDQLRVLREHSISLLEVGQLGSYPYHRLFNANNPEAVREAMEHYLSQGIPCMPDKYAMKRLVVGQKGVNALWVGMKDGRFKTVNETKMSKFLNRGYNSLAIPAAEGQPESPGYRPYREAALHIGSAQNPEDAIRIYGDPSRCLFTNLRSMQNGSGGALCQREFAYGVPKTIRGTLTASHLPEGRELEDVKQYLEAELTQLCQTGKVLPQGERTVLLSYRGLELLVWDQLNQPAKVDINSTFSVRQLATSESLQINLTVTFYASDECVKLRGLGIKAVTTPSNVEVYGPDGRLVEWEVLFGTETQKGIAARLHLYSEYMMKKYGKPTFYNPSESTLDYWNGREWKTQDLRSPQAPIYAWVKKNMQPLRVRGWMSLPYFKAMVAAHAGMPKDQDGVVEAALQHPDNQDLVLIDKNTGEVTQNLEAATEDGAVFVEERCEGILGDYVGQIELTTRRESTSRSQSATLEYQALTWATSPKLGARLIDTGRESEEALISLVSMVSNKPDLVHIVNYGPALVKRPEPMELDAAFAYELNQSKFNLGKNELFYQNVTDPFWAFSSPEDKRKKFQANMLMANEMALTPKDIREGESHCFQELCHRVAQHMSINVGTGYGMGSAITLKAVLLRKELEDANKAMDLERFNLVKAQLIQIQAVLSRVWEHKYEDMDLAGLNVEGEYFNQLLQNCVGGQYEEGNGKLSRDETLELISKAYFDAKGLELPPYQAYWMLWSFQMARGVSALEKKAEMPLWAEAMKEDIILCAAFRRCGQGLYARYVTAEEEDSKEYNNKGGSPWTYLDAHWESLQHKLPGWLARKLWLTMMLHTELNEATALKEKAEKAEQDAFSGSNSSLRSFMPEMQETEHPIPRIIIQDACANSSSTVMLEVEPGKFEERSFEDLQGAFQLLAEAEEGQDPQVLTSREIFQAAERRYPRGVIIASENAKGDLTSQYINFGAFLKLGAFTSGGFCTGSAYALLELMMMMSRYNRGETGRDQKLHHKFESFRGMLLKWVSRGAIKKLSRSGPVFMSSKVLTSHENDVNPVNVRGNDGKVYELPVILVNPNDDLVRQGYLREKSIYAVSRTPMVSRFYAVVLFSEDVPVASVKVSAMTWAMSNRGDGDGDPITLENLFKVTSLAPKS
jgi:hypothetical protein